MSYNLKISKMQAKVINKALDLYTRLLLGDLYELKRLYKDKDPDVSVEYIDTLCSQLKRIFVPALPDGVSYGIPAGSEDAKMAYDLIQVIRHRIAWDENPGGGAQVGFHDPMKFANHDLAEIEKDEETM